MDSSYTPGKAPLAVLMEASPRRVAFSEMVSATRARLAAAACPSDPLSDAALRIFLIDLHDAGIVDFHSHATLQCLNPGEFPEASPVALWQAGRGYFASSLRHVGYTFTQDPAIHLFRLLDGEWNRPEIVRDLLANPEARTALLESGLPTDEQFAALSRVVDREIEHLARLGMLIR